MTDTPSAEQKAACAHELADIRAREIARGAIATTATESPARIYEVRKVERPNFVKDAQEDDEVREARSCTQASSTEVEIRLEPNCTQLQIENSQMKDAKSPLKGDVRSSGFGEDEGPIDQAPIIGARTAVSAPESVEGAHTGKEGCRCKECKIARIQAIAAEMAHYDEGDAPPQRDRDISETIKAAHSISEDDILVLVDGKAQPPVRKANSDFAHYDDYFEKETAKIGTIHPDGPWRPVLDSEQEVALAMSHKRHELGLDRKAIEAVIKKRQHGEAIEIKSVGMITAVKYKPESMLLAGTTPRGTAWLMAGASGIAKTWVILYTCTAAACGMPTPFGAAVPPIRILYCDSECGDSEMHRRLEGILAGLPNDEARELVKKNFHFVIVM